MAECEHLRVGREFLESVSWPFAFRQEAHDRCYCERCYPPHLRDTMDVANYTYVIPRGWTRFAISVDEGFFNHHDVWDKWLNCYHGTSIENAKSCVEHRHLLLPNDTTMHGKKLEIREGHIKGEHYVFTTPSITYAALDYYAHTYHFQSPYNSQIYTIKVVLQCKQKPDSIIVQPETVDARRQGIKICRYIPNDKLEWKTQHRSTVTIYGLLLEVKQYHVHNHSNSFQYQQIRNTQNVSYESATISQTPSPPPFKTKLLITFKSCSDDIFIGGGISGCVSCLLVFFFLGWLITGSIWVFPAKSKVQYNQYNETNYCQENLYKFTFGLLLAQYSLIGLVICCGGILALLGLCLG
ncbi:unnamed protein product [Adineta steineri]|uniref:Uncharacterized protein n=1 Tax=Adineta steineri TaxID=433720 RepID=A0A814RB91_9BILA|nr:unnamed protein product [Adineta steineri]CAF1279721.1 unnamed protein product [Adineta steineri]